MKRTRAAIGAILIAAICAWIAVDRYRLQDHIARLEWELGLLKLAHDMAQYRQQHPIRHGG